MAKFETLNYYQRINYIFQCLTFSICVIGIVGNVLVIVVFSHKSLRKYSYSFYSQVKAVGDTLVLLFGIRNWSRFVMDANLDTLSPFICAVFNKYLIYVGTILSIWLIAFITLDRLVTIIYPNRFHFFRKRWFQFTIVGIVFVYSNVVNIMLPINTNLKTQPSKTQNSTLVTTCLATPEILAKHSWIISSHISVVILVFNNILIVRLILFIAASRTKVSATTRQSKNRISSKDRKFAITTIVLSLLAVVFKLPKMMVNIIMESAGLTDDYYQMWFSIGITIYDIEAGCSFFVNLLLNSVFFSNFMRTFFGRNNASQLSLSRSVNFNNNFENTLY